MSYSTTLANLSQRDAIADALYRVVIGIDTNDKALFNSGFISNDVVFEMNGNRMEGLDVIHENMFSNVGPLDTTHFISNVRVDAKEGAETASMTAYALAQHYKPGEGMMPDTKRLLSGSMYWIDVVKDGESGLWKVKSWIMKIIWVEGDMSIVTG